MTETGLKVHCWSHETYFWAPSSICITYWKKTILNWDLRALRNVVPYTFACDVRQAQHGEIKHSENSASHTVAWLCATNTFPLWWILVVQKGKEVPLLSSYRHDKTEIAITSFCRSFALGRRSIGSMVYDCVVIVVELSVSGALSHQHQRWLETGRLAQTARVSQRCVLRMLVIGGWCRVWQVWTGRIGVEYFQQCLLRVLWSV